MLNSVAEINFLLIQFLKGSNAMQASVTSPKDAGVLDRKTVASVLIGLFRVEVKRVGVCSTAHWLKVATTL